MVVPQPPQVAPPEQPLPAGLAPEDVAPSRPSFRDRGRLRRRLRYLRRVRELGFRDLGGLAFDLHRFGRRNDDLVLGKLAALDAVDRELRAIERVLDERRDIFELREPGVAACPRCGALHGSDARFCPQCGIAFSGPLAMVEVGGVAQPAPEAAPIATQPVGEVSPAEPAARRRSPARWRATRRRRRRPSRRRSRPPPSRPRLRSRPTPSSRRLRASPAPTAASRARRGRAGRQRRRAADAGVLLARRPRRRPARPARAPGAVSTPGARAASPGPRPPRCAARAAARPSRPSRTGAWSAARPPGRAWRRRRTGARRSPRRGRDRPRRRRLRLRLQRPDRRRRQRLLGHRDHAGLDARRRHDRPDAHGPDRPRRDADVADARARRSRAPAASARAASATSQRRTRRRPVPEPRLDRVGRARSAPTSRRRSASAAAVRRLTASTRTRRSSPVRAPSG